jgi:hypothetical protein
VPKWMNGGNFELEMNPSNVLPILIWVEMDFRQILLNEKISFSKLLRLVDSNSKAEVFFEQIGVLNYRRPKCICGISGQIFFTRNIDTTLKAGFRWRCNHCCERVNPLCNTFFSRKHGCLIYK